MEEATETGAAAGHRRRRGARVSASQNGWPVDPTGRLEDHTAVAGVTFPNGVRNGDVATVLLYLARRFHETVEPLHPGWCWGWYVRRIEGSARYSNHSSGTAIDFNAPSHPQGRRGTFSAAEVAAIRQILAYLDGAVRWGGDYTSGPDEMHFEIAGTAAEVARVAAKIKGRRRVSYVQIEGRLPVLRQGDEDPVDTGGTEWIKRAQKQLGLPPDGKYGDRTAAAVAAVMRGDSARTTTNGSTIALPEWRRLYGIW